ncbi:MAG: 16S rRNA (guanine(527)-N(7))-methyltransferase RsmG [SAR324 cluster bacterium]|nr:16S rRNA (guanine(527)-N(7))-methyltransferase RsmG [SAR324 cluster bacterium]MCH8888250.1 16S rRNA (guanine(527)-N(7))-methyltransferase RsmG [SAR324 cluster bacterium]
MSLIDSELTAHGIFPDRRQRDRLNHFVEMLESWNRRINLTGARNRATLMRRHILDCLMLETVERPSAFNRWADLGSGAGLPAFPIAIMHPEYSVVSVEKVGKKATFQQFAARSLGLENLIVHKGNAALLANGMRLNPEFDVVVARAFAKLPLLMEFGAKLLRPGGQLWAMKGKRWREEFSEVSPRLLERFAPGPQTHSYLLEKNAPPGWILVWTRRPDAQAGEKNRLQRETAD